MYDFQTIAAAAALYITAAASFVFTDGVPGQDATDPGKEVASDSAENAHSVEGTKALMTIVDGHTVNLTVSGLVLGDKVVDVTKVAHAHNNTI